MPSKIGNIVLLQIQINITSKHIHFLIKKLLGANFIVICRFIFCIEYAIYVSISIQSYRSYLTYTSVNVSKFANLFHS
jgi:hypothetical protein